MFFRLILNDKKTCFIKEGKNLLDIKEKLEKNKFLTAINNNTGNTELINVSNVYTVRISSNEKLEDFFEKSK